MTVIFRIPRGLFDIETRENIKDYKFKILTKRFDSNPFYL